MKISTQAVRIGVGKDATGAMSFPIYQNATFSHPAFGKSTGYDYSRSGNPTRQVLEEGIALLDGGCRGFAYASGMAAIANLLLLFGQGDHLVVTEDLYGGTFRLLDKVFARQGLEATYVDTSDVAAVAGAIRKNTRAILLEVPTNPLLKVSDIRKISALAKEKGILTIVDNTFLTPYLLRPLDLGADMTVYSATKFISGHNDVIAGLVAVKEEELGKQVYFLQNSVGAVLGPQDSWLVIRGLKTLSVRIDRQLLNAQRIAEWLSGRQGVQRIYYPGLKKDPGYRLLKKQARGFGAMVSFEVADRRIAEEVLRHVQLISFAESLGGVETLITYPAFQTHADMDPLERERMGINDRLLRLSVGIEDGDDLLADLAQALEKAEKSA
ncbi:MAG: PLP-dependent aspartate aminotransferase family protein [Deltaproteobacteria bacterium]|nr:PLP-dependent aspartate aminotransferase family protein [Deltaproteobacteria bacterium]